MRNLNIGLLPARTDCVRADTPLGCPTAMSSSIDEPDSRSRLSSILGILIVLVVALIAMAFLFGGFSPFGFLQSPPSSRPAFELVFSREKTSRSEEHTSELQSPIDISYAV